ncbi:hypothetical protein CFR73_07030 [Novacetimonas maltaceti]|uniref:Uncharacterized protein n=2 Tax=Novacetimonas maltaceti TaxID=1203393 RepID=A0A2S3VZM1_9PROT|nr:hypothetical protein KMAL_23280 [Novacetimonas maltaceti]PYD60413.1 hypothetical protein CFR73_07030 [Novacetimonas maltaceti]
MLMVERAKDHKQPKPAPDAALFDDPMQFAGDMLKALGPQALQVATTRAGYFLSTGDFRRAIAWVRVRRILRGWLDPTPRADGLH